MGSGPSNSHRTMAKKKETTEEPKQKAPPAELTPSAYALEKVGPAPDTDDPEKLLAHGEKYLAAKLERRHGHG
jgi:hypothetical protein